MHTKLKLKIELYDDVVLSTNGDETIGNFIQLTVLDKDDRFEASYSSKLGNYIRFGGSGFSIKSNINKSFGGLNTDSLILPTLDKMGFKYTKYFTTDKERYNYLKILYETLIDWSNYWVGFSEDTTSRMEVKDDIWEIVCEKTSTYLHDVY